MENSVDPDETAYYELSHLDLHCLHKIWFWSAGLKGNAKFSKATAEVSKFKYRCLNSSCIWGREAEICRQKSKWEFTKVVYLV